MNYMKQVAQMLGVDIGEEFGISGFPNNIYKFDHQHLLCRNKLYRMDWSKADMNILDLLSGEAEIIKFNKSVLNEKEKEFLSAVIKPFRERIEFILKIKVDEEYEDLLIRLKDDERISFPKFKRGTMYSGMDICVAYLPEGLDL